jgi:hypothetical protein
MKSNTRGAKEKTGGAVQRNTSSRENDRRNPSDDGDRTGTGKRSESAYSGDNQPDRPLDDADDNLDGETW